MPCSGEPKLTNLQKTYGADLGAVKGFCHAAAFAKKIAAVDINGLAAKNVSFYDKCRDASAGDVYFEIGHIKVGHEMIKDVGLAVVDRGETDAARAFYKKVGENLAGLAAAGKLTVSSETDVTATGMVQYWGVLVPVDNACDSLVKCITCGCTVKALFGESAAKACASKKKSRKGRK